MKLNWKVSYIVKVQMQTSSWLMQRPWLSVKPYSRILHPVAFLVGRQELQGGNSQCNIALLQQTFALIYHRKTYIYRAYCTYRWSKHNLTWVAPSFPMLVYCLPQWSWIHRLCEKIFFVGTNVLVKFQIYSLTFDQ